MDEESTANFIGMMSHYYTCSMCGNTKSFKNYPIIPVFIDAHIYGVCSDCKKELDTGQSKGIGFTPQSDNESEDGHCQQEMVNAYSGLYIPEDLDREAEQRLHRIRSK